MRKERAEWLAWRKLWLDEHPGRTCADHSKVINSDEYLAWRRAKGAQMIERMRQAWLKDHPRQTAADFERVSTCAASDDERVEFSQWSHRWEQTNDHS